MYKFDREGHLSKHTHIWWSLHFFTIEIPTHCKMMCLFLSWLFKKMAASKDQGLWVLLQTQTMAIMCLWSMFMCLSSHDYYLFFSSFFHLLPWQCWQAEKPISHIVTIDHKSWNLLLLLLISCHHPFNQQCCIVGPTTSSLRLLGYKRLTSGCWTQNKGS